MTRWLSTLTLACWSGILLYFYLSGRLVSFLHPAFRPGVLVAGLLLAVFALCAAAGGKAACCGENEPCVPKTAATFAPARLLAFAVLLLPLAMVFCSSHDGFGAAAIANRGVAMDASKIAAPRSGPGLGGSPAAADASNANPYAPRTASGALDVSVLDLLYAAGDPTLQPDFDGKTVELVGQLMAENEASPGGNRMKIVRMWMTCCAADARPIATLIELPAGMKNTLPELSWVRVNGIASFPKEGDRTIAVLKVKSLKPTDPPEETMLGF